MQTAVAGPRSGRRRARAHLQDPDSVGIDPPRKFTRADAGAEYGRLLRLRAELKARLRALDPTREEPKRTKRETPPVTTRIWKIGDLITPRPDQIGPAVGLGDELGGDVSAGGAADVESGEDRGLSVDAIYAFIERAVGRLDPRSMEVVRDELVITGTPAAHAEAERTLKRLRDLSLRHVELELRVLALDRTILGKLQQPAALTEADEAALAAAIKADPKVLIARRRVVAADGRRVCLHSGDSRSVVSALFVDQTGVVPVVNPVVLAVHEGTFAELRAAVESGGDRVHVDLALARSSFLPEPLKRTISGIELEQPEMAMDRLTSNAVLRVGRGALVGGTIGADGEHLMVYLRARVIGAATGRKGRK